MGRQQKVAEEGLHCVRVLQVLQSWEKGFIVLVLL